MPGLASYERKMRGAGLMVLGVARRSTREAAVEVASKAGVEFPITDGGTLPGIDEKKVPQYTVYGHTGEIAFKQTTPFESEDGLSPECRAAIEKALSRAFPTLAVAVEQFQEPEIVKLARKANTGAGLGKVLSDLDARIAAGSEAEKAEGERLRDEIIAYGERVLADAEAVRADRPHRHFDMMKQLAKQFKGHDIGNQADSVVESIKKDKAAMREVEASRLYEELAGAPEKERRKIYATLKKKYAQTRFAQRATDEMGEESPDSPTPDRGRVEEQDEDDEGDDE